LEIANRKTRIMNIIERRQSIGFNELKRVVCEEQKIISERPFRELLKELVEAKLVVREPQKDSQSVLYSIGGKTFDSAYAQRRLREHNDILQKKIEDIKQIFTHMSSAEQSHLVYSISPLIEKFRMEAAITMRYYPKGMQEEYSRLSRLQEELLKIIGSEAKELTANLRVIYALSDSEIVSAVEQLDEQVRLYNICYGGKTGRKTNA
jgi:hypothetical protein